MIILPAIDLLDGKPVRLYQGNYESQVQVSPSAQQSAQYFNDLGAEYLHLVDLNGAKYGERIHFPLIKRIADETGMKVEVGGGIRTMEDIEAYLNAGVDRVILGTAALKEPEILKEALKRYGERIAVGIDCKDGFVSVAGWLDDSKVNYLDFAKQMEQLGVKTIIFTDISKDGTLSGPNLEMLQQLKDSVNVDLIASGGIKDIEDIKALKKLGVHGAIVGKSIYAKTLDLKEAIDVSHGDKTC